MPRWWPFGKKRAIDLASVGRLDEERADLLSTPEARRWARRDVDLMAIYGAVYAAVRRRMAAIVKPEIILMRQVGQELIEVDANHPALKALHRVNESLTFRQGLGLIEQNKLSAGKAFWIKRRNGLKVPVEFEIWPPQEVEILPDKEKPWVPAIFRRHKRNGTIESVAPEDVIWFRHMVDPRNPLNALSPIGAIRLELDTGMEARRFNQAYFDNMIRLGQIFGLGGEEGASAAEVARVEKELATKFRGPDSAYKAAVVSGELKPLESSGPPHKDMEFLAQLRWGVEEVCRVFEIAPELLGLGSRTYENAPAANKMFWQVMADQHAAMMEEFTEFYIWPDFGEEYVLMGRYGNIPALQEDKKFQAEVDEIRLKNAVVTVNEVRDREGMEAVSWGDVPLVPNTVMPLMTGKPSPAHSLERSADTDMREAWEHRLRAELDALIKHLEAADRRDIQLGDVDSYDWDWEGKYGKSVQKELSVVYLAALQEKGFVETPLLSAQQLASQYAKERMITILDPAGRQSITATTRQWVRGLVAQTIEEGESLNTLSKNLRQGFEYSKPRAQRIALTETRSAITKGSLASWQSLGYEGKQWSTTGAACPICQEAEGDGPIPLGSPFSNGYEGPPAHPNCLCNLDPVYELPRAAVRVGGNGQRA